MAALCIDTPLPAVLPLSVTICRHTRAPGAGYFIRRDAQEKLPAQYAPHAANRENSSLFGYN